MATRPTVHAQGPTPDGDVAALADATFTIAAARQHEVELQAAREAFAARDAEIRALTARQAASIEVLKTISASPDDPQPVFDLIARCARALCGAATMSITEYDGTLLHVRVMEGFDLAATERMRQAYPRPPEPNSMHGRALLSGETIHARDLSTDTQLSQLVRDLRVASRLTVPLRREGQAIGVLSLGRFEPGGFNDAEVALVESFSEQASLAIAIASAATLRELRARTGELAQRNSEYGERIEQQSATIDVLKVMSASPGDAQPVFELIAERARAFCEADGAAVALLEDDRLHLRTHRGYADSSSQKFEARFPLAIDTTSIMGRTILAREAMQVPDILADHGHIASINNAVDMRSVVGVPMLRAGMPIGTITLGRRAPGDFSAMQMELLKTFAEQAVIAIGSAETYRALQERTVALAQRNDEYGEKIEHQSATIDVLKVMSASPGDTQPVFDLIVRRARDLCSSTGAALFEFDGEVFRFSAMAYASDRSAVTEALRRMYPVAPARDSINGRALLDRQVVHVRDRDVEPGLSPVARSMAQRSQLSIPLLRDGFGVGVIAIANNDPGGFSDSQVELLKTFAEQAVIAISSAETHRALQERTAALTQRNSEFGERIEQQAATIDVLKVMSGSPDDTQPVFDLIIRRAQELCNANAAALYQFDGALIRLVATHRAVALSEHEDRAFRN